MLLLCEKEESLPLVFVVALTDVAPFTPTTTGGHFHVLNNISSVPCTIDYTTFPVSGKVERS